jgi:hypothetical protein
VERNGDKRMSTTVHCSRPGHSDVGRAGHRACIIASPAVWVHKGQPEPACPVRFMLSLGLRTRRTSPLLPGVVHSHNYSARRLTRWLPRRSGTLPPPPRHGAAGGGARSFAAYSIAITVGAGVGFIAYENYQPFRHTVLAIVRCSRVAGG